MAFYQVRPLPRARAFRIARRAREAGRCGPGWPSLAELRVASWRSAGEHFRPVPPVARATQRPLGGRVRRTYHRRSRQRRAFDRRGIRIGAGVHRGGRSAGVALRTAIEPPPATACASRHKRQSRYDYEPLHGFCFLSEESLLPGEAAGQPTLQHAPRCANATNGFFSQRVFPGRSMRNRR